MGKSRCYCCLHLNLPLPRGGSTRCCQSAASGAWRGEHCFGTKTATAAAITSIPLPHQHGLSLCAASSTSIAFCFRLRSEAVRLCLLCLHFSCPLRISRCLRALTRKIAYKSKVSVVNRLSRQHWALRLDARRCLTLGYDEDCRVRHLSPLAVSSSRRRPSRSWTCL